MRRVCPWLVLVLAIARGHALSLLTYNVAGNGTTDWSTNAPQVQAIGRQMAFLRPDVMTFNEIPYTNTWQMANFVAAYLPGYFLATNSAADGFIRKRYREPVPDRARLLVTEDGYVHLFGPIHFAT